MYFSGLVKIFALRIILTLAKKSIVLFYLVGERWFPANKRQGIWILGPWVMFGKVVK